MFYLYFQMMPSCWAGVGVGEIGVRCCCDSRAGSKLVKTLWMSRGEVVAII